MRIVKKILDWISGFVLFSVTATLVLLIAIMFLWALAAADEKVREPSPHPTSTQGAKP